MVVVLPAVEAYLACYVRKGKKYAEVGCYAFSGGWYSSYSLFVKELRVVPRVYREVFSEALQNVLLPRGCGTKRIHTEVKPTTGEGMRYYRVRVEEGNVEVEEIGECEFLGGILREGEEVYTTRLRKGGNVLTWVTVAGRGSEGYTVERRRGLATLLFGEPREGEKVLCTRYNTYARLSVIHGTLVSPITISPVTICVTKSLLKKCGRELLPVV